MKRRSDTPTRGEVTETVETSQMDMEEKEGELDRIASEVESVRHTLECLDFSGTAEGSEQVEEAIEGAESVTIDVFDTEDDHLEQIQDDNLEYEEELQERHGSSESDLGKVADAASTIETSETITELDRARDAALQDIDFLLEQIERASEARERSEEVQERHKARIHAGQGRS